MQLLTCRLATFQNYGDPLPYTDAALLATERKGVLIMATNLKLLGNILSRFRHGIGAIHFLHERVNESPANGCIEDSRVTAES